MMAERAWRMHHYVWHSVRDGWDRFDDATKTALRDMGWEPPRPARRIGPNGEDVVDVDNDSGEDFLFMHRGMIAAVNAKLEEVKDPNYPVIVPWGEIPRPGSADYPVPPPYPTGDSDLDARLVKVKSDEYFNEMMLAWEAKYTDPAVLRSMSLGKLGANLEVTVHNNMHMRWSGPPVPGMRPDSDVTHPEEIDVSWDLPQYNWLGDTYSSHVNPVFWKLHGWIDARIEDWKRANGVVGDIPWRGTWIGKMPMMPDHSMHVVSTLMQRLSPTMFASAAGDGHGGGHGHDHDHGDLESLTAAVRIIMRSGVQCHFYDDVRLPS